MSKEGIDYHIEMERDHDNQEGTAALSSKRPRQTSDEITCTTHLGDLIVMGHSPNVAEARHSAALQVL